MVAIKPIPACGLNIAAVKPIINLILIFEFHGFWPLKCLHHIFIRSHPWPVTYLYGCVASNCLIINSTIVMLINIFIIKGLHGT